MSSLNFRKNIIGATDWLVTGQFIADGVDMLAKGWTAYNALMDADVTSRVSPPFTPEELQAFGGDILPDHSWRKTDHNLQAFVASPKRAKLFMENTQSCATIMVRMMDIMNQPEMAYSDIPCKPNYQDKRAKLGPRPLISGPLIVGDQIYSSGKIAALQGLPLKDGSWFCVDDPTCVVTEAEASYFMQQTQKSSSIMVQMLDHMQSKGVLDVLDCEHDVVDEHSSLVPSSAELLSLATFDPRQITSRHELVITILSYAPSCIQSFFGNQSIVHDSSQSLADAPILRDDVLHIPPFDESLFCKIVLENHRYTLAQLYDARNEAAEQKAQRWMKYGILAAVFTLNPLMPFFLSNQGRLSADRGKKLDELIPDPFLMFLQDKYSFLKMTHGGTPMPQMRRIIFHPIVSDATVYLRVIPAALTQTSVIPLQVFQINRSYFLRPVAAGIEPDQPNYNARKIHRLYYHLRADGQCSDTGERIAVSGEDIDESSHKYRLYRYISDTRELDYFYIDYATEPGHVF